MIPLVVTRRELDRMRALVDKTAESVFARAGARVAFLFGTMIELPRAALLANEIAEGADFFSFGTNDLTQTAMGLSRDDAGKFLAGVHRAGAISRRSVPVARRRGGRRAGAHGRASGGAPRSPTSSSGVCGEHGGDPASIRFFHAQELDYVSCSPFRVPIARLAAAQAAVNQRAG